MLSLQHGSKLIGKLPKGCKYCATGGKLVLFITGLCSRRCFYCPLSRRKKGRDVVFANERKVNSINEIIDEARLIDALGTGMTGGNPMVVPERTLNYIKLLKQNFTDKHHIHLYTTGDFEKRYIKELADVGLDEIRIHPDAKYWDKIENTIYEKTLNELLNTNIDVGVEIPVIPGYERKITNLIKFVSKVGVYFIILNELEYSETNCNALNKIGFTVKNDISSAVSGSEKIAYNLMKTIDVDISLHYCSVAFKNGVQLKNRIMRRAKNIAKEYDVITDDGTLLKGIILCKKMIMEKVVNELICNYNIPNILINIDTEKNRIEIAPWILEKISKKLPYKCFIVEEYPTADRLEVERILLH